MITARRLIAALVAAAMAAAMAAAVGLAGTAGSSTSSAHWVCVYVDHVHVTVCQGKPIDFAPDEDSVGGLVSKV